ncbi:type III pantothenate kinase [Tamlana fucoidanivorans]|uniref:Type III pantothenate kinase n=1 Tax=Allotamlana fucoidanivorans TaxID=2583814 RepID=A0A5C4SCG8_9FLAO|nr:type III pantothenate kinase [Tamlana fucoidanivorans]TNJ41257.1 type III pantothenate kinase [Tamlana fucoidanivorans]
MNLVIDVGNSFVKLAVFKSDEIQYREVIRLKAVLEAISVLKARYSNLNKAIISSVGQLNQYQIASIQGEFDTLILGVDTLLPFHNQYKTPKTLGVDRIALVSAAINLYPNNNTLIIDAGTCITYDFVNSQKQYLGGAIAPGLMMRYKSLNNLTANLPLLKLSMPQSITGNSTTECMHSGVVFGVINEIEGAIAQYQDKYSDLTVILTGGDAKFLSKQLKSSIFAHSNFLLEGLNYILQINSNE